MTEPTDPQDETPDEKDTGPTAAQDTDASAATGLAVAALVLAVAALAVLGWDWFKDGRAEMDQRLDAQASRVEALDRAFQDLNRERVRSAELQRLQDRVADRMEGFAQRLAQAEDDLGRIRSDLTSGRAAFRESQALFLLDLADDVLAVTGDADAALRALRAADQALADSGDPALRPVRARIAEDIVRLEASAGVDRQGIALSLTALEQRVSELPLAESPPDSFDAPRPDAADADQAPWWRRALSRAGDALKGLFTLRRVEGETRPLLAPDQVYFLRRNLELELASARLALIAGDAASYRASIRQARDWTARYFDLEQPAARSFLDELVELEGADLATERPDISGALRMMERALGREAGREGQG